MAVLMGRRRVGKTSLALEFAHDKRYVYLFVAKKSETLLCKSFSEEIKNKLGVAVLGEFTQFKDLFAWLMEFAKKEHLTVIVDEFQEFFSINPSVYSEIQCLWDLNKKSSKMQVIFIGSLYSMMSKIFENEKEPLFGRADRILRLQPFSIHELKIILSDYGIKDLQRLFDFYVLTGGVPKYIDILLTNKCFTLNKALDFMLKENSVFLNEGRNQLIEEFGKDYVTYFSILELIARGKTSTSEIQSVIQKNISAYIDKLEGTYGVINKYKPIDAKPNAKTQKYQINDNFLKFWFSFFHRYRDAIEIKNFYYMKEIIKRDYSSYSGRLLEKFFVELIAATKKYNKIGAYWERGHVNEIDIVAINDIEKILVVAEVKTAQRRNSLSRLEHRAEKLVKHYPHYHVEYLTLSLDDAKEYTEI